jgi:hypothetical protein
VGAQLRALPIACGAQPGYTRRACADVASQPLQKLRRFLIVVLALFAVMLALAALALRVPAVAAVVADLPVGPGLDPTPQPPVIAAPRGPLPHGLAGLRELAQSAGQPYQSVGCGFFLRLPSGQEIGVTTAHSVAALGQPGNDLQRVAFSLPGSLDASRLADFKDLYGLPGAPRSGPNLSVDFVLLLPPGPVDPALALEADVRGAPQPGERVALYSGLGGPDGARRVLLGTVTSSDPTNAWLLMDDRFDPSGMSGSPVLSAQTGRVVGMAVAATRRRGRVLIGLNPIGAIVQHAEAARDFPAIEGYRR